MEVVIGYALIIFVVFMLIYAGIAASHFVLGLRHRSKTLATERDYAPQAQLLGNGGHHLGKFDFYVTVCPACKNNDEYEGCPNCHSHEAKVKIENAGSSILIKCPICKHEKWLNPRCSQCGAIETIQFINFYKGRFIPKQEARTKETRGQTLPRQKTARPIEMPPDVAPPKKRSPRI